MRVMPERLLEIAEWLGRRKVRLLKGNENRRIDSVKAHTEILQLLLQQRNLGVIPFPSESPPWYSFQVPTADGTCYVKLKVSSFSRADNLNCRGGIYYALTGVGPVNTETSSWDKYFYMLSRNLDADRREDFYFLVMNCLETNDVFCNSLKGLSEIKPNGSNLPFQCNWSDNREPSQRTDRQATEYILGQLEKSAQLRAEMLHAYNKHFPT